MEFATDESCLAAALAAGRTTKVLIGSQLTNDELLGNSELVGRLSRVQTALQPLRVVRAARLEVVAQWCAAEFAKKRQEHRDNQVAAGKSPAAGWVEPPHPPGQWHRARSRSLGVPLHTRYQWGHDNPLALAHVDTAAVGAACTCRQLVCPDCERGRARKLYGRVAAVVGVHDSAARSVGLEPVMLTLTLRDTAIESPAEAVRIFRAAWPSMRKALQAVGMGEAYIRAEEYTPGKVGHVHWHLVCWLPPWVDYAALHRAWWRGLALAGIGAAQNVDVWQDEAKGRFGRPPIQVRWIARPDCGTDRQDGERSVCGAEPCSHHTPGAVNVRRSSDPQTGTGDSAADAAAYCIKASNAAGAVAYALKGDPGAKCMTDDAACDRFASYIDGRYGQRRFSGSAYFWQGGKNIVTKKPWLQFVSDWKPVPVLTGIWPPRLTAAPNWFDPAVPVVELVDHAVLPTEAVPQSEPRVARIERWRTRLQPPTPTLDNS